ncbi:MAG: hypothetical protein IMX00_00870 [Limnochordales bacterium]|nr:hypothetical protein [Limnochordales bacterium]
MPDRVFREYDLWLTIDQPLFVGGPPDPMSEFHSPVARIGGRAVIPGTSVKGALRSQLERLLIQQAARNPVFRPCIPFPFSRLSADEHTLVRAGVYRGGACEYGKGPICPACYFLGCQSLPGFVMVPYLEADKDPEPAYAAARDRATSAVHRGFNRNVEVMPPGTTFRGVLRILIEDQQRKWTLGREREHLEPNTDSWLRELSHEERHVDRLIDKYVVEPLKSICSIGGKVSTGHGWVRGALEVKLRSEVAV